MNPLIFVIFLTTIGGVLALLGAYYPRGGQQYQRQGSRIYSLPLRFKVVETAANTFTQIRIDTPRKNLTGVVMAIRGIMWTIDPSKALGDGDTYEIMISSQPHAAMADLDFPGVIWYSKEQVHVGAAGTMWVRHDRQINFPAPIGYCMDDIYISILSASDATALRCSGQILYSLHPEDPTTFNALTNR